MDTLFVQFGTGYLSYFHYTHTGYVDSWIGPCAYISYYTAVNGDITQVVQ